VLRIDAGSEVEEEVGERRLCGGMSEGSFVGPGRWDSFDGIDEGGISGKSGRISWLGRLILDRDEGVKDLRDRRDEKTKERSGKSPIKACTTMDRAVFSGRIGHGG